MATPMMAEEEVRGLLEAFEESDVVLHPPTDPINQPVQVTLYLSALAQIDILRTVLQMPPRS